MPVAEALHATAGRHRTKIEWLAPVRSIAITRNAPASRDCVSISTLTIPARPGGAEWDAGARRPIRTGSIPPVSPPVAQRRCRPVRRRADGLRSGADPGPCRGKPPCCAVSGRHRFAPLAAKGSLGEEVVVQRADPGLVGLCGAMTFAPHAVAGRAPNGLSRSLQAPGRRRPGHSAGWALSSPWSCRLGSAGATWA